MSTTNLGVYQAISDVSAEIAKTGIAKDRKNDQQGYKFRGIDDVYNALAPILAAHGLVILPHVFSREVVERQTKSGGTLFYTTVGVDYSFVAAKDGSVHVVRTYGEAMDSGDKSTNKAMSAAYKYACMQAFCIPTEGDHDTENQTHEVAPAQKSEPKKPGTRRVPPPELGSEKPPPVPVKPEGFDEWWGRLEFAADNDGLDRLQNIWKNPDAPDADKPFRVYADAVLTEQWKALKHDATHTTERLRRLAIGKGGA